MLAEQQSELNMRIDMRVDIVAGMYAFAVAPPLVGGLLNQF